MNGKAPHLGLILLKGDLKSYEISGRSIRYASSNMRQAISLLSEKITLKAYETHEDS